VTDKVTGFGSFELYPAAKDSDRVNSPNDQVSFTKNQHLKISALKPLLGEVSAAAKKCR